MRKREWIDPRTTAVRFSDWAKLWLENDPGKRETTRARDESVVRLHLNPVFGHAWLRHITPMDVQHAVNTWAMDYATKTTIRHYQTLSAILSSAVNSDVLLKSPCRAIKLPRGPAMRTTRIVTPEELDRLVDELGRYGLMAQLGAVLGLRYGEVAGLRGS